MTRAAALAHPGCRGRSPAVKGRSCDCAGWRSCRILAGIVQDPCGALETVRDPTRTPHRPCSMPYGLRCSNHADRSECHTMGSALCGIVQGALEGARHCGRSRVCQVGIVWDRVGSSVGDRGASGDPARAGALALVCSGAGVKGGSPCTSTPTLLSGWADMRPHGEDPSCAPQWSSTSQPHSPA